MRLLRYEEYVPQTVVFGITQATSVTWRAAQLPPFDGWTRPSRAVWQAAVWTGGGAHVGSSPRLCTDRAKHVFQLRGIDQHGRAALSKPVGRAKRSRAY